MITTVANDYHFCSAHFLPNVPDTHKCKRMHGHNYRLTIKIEAEVDVHSGMVLDFFDLDAVMEPLVKSIDHRTLNEFVGLENPTAELIAVWFLSRINLSAVPTPYRVGCRVYETPECWAEIWENRS